MKKLFKVVLEFEAAALAETEGEACDFINEMLDDVSDLSEYTTASPIVGGKNRPMNWNDKDLVYCCYEEDGEMTLAEAIEFMKEREGDTKTLPLPLVEKEKK